MNTNIIEVDGVEYKLNVHYERRQDSRVSIGRKEINIRIPYFLNREEMFRQLQNMKSWAIKKIEDSPDRFKPTLQREYKDGDMLKCGDDEYKLNISFKHTNCSSAKIIGQEIYLILCSDLTKDKQNKCISTLLSRLIARIKHPMLTEKINNLNEKHFKQKVNKVYFKYNKSNWGSCSSKGNINISTRVFFLPDDVLEYICIHELAHLIQPNHSESFWKLVENAMPNYQEKKQWLKDNGDNYWF